MLRGTGLALLLAATAFAVPHHPLNAQASNHLSPVGLPRCGQAAFVLGNGRPAASPHEQPAAIAGNTSELLAAAGEAAEQLVDSVYSATRVRTAGASGAVSGPRGNVGGHGYPLLPAPGRPSARPYCRRNHYPQEST